MNYGKRFSPADLACAVPPFETGTLLESRVEAVNFACRGNLPLYMKGTQSVPYEIFTTSWRGKGPVLVPSSFLAQTHLMSVSSQPENLIE